LEERFCNWEADTESIERRIGEGECEGVVESAEGEEKCSSTGQSECPILRRVGYV
jgi:hypothetical protein